MNEWINKKKGAFRSCCCCCSINGGGREGVREGESALSYLVCCHCHWWNVANMCDVDVNSNTLVVRYRHPTLLCSTYSSPSFSFFFSIFPFWCVGGKGGGGDDDGGGSSSHAVDWLVMLQQQQQQQHNSSCSLLTIPHTHAADTGRHDH